jgi:D-sedoheptulose 7-phosphate isomerase
VDNNVKFVEKYLRDSFEVREKVSASQDVLAQVAMVAELILQVYINGGKVLIAGNGGSAADAQHIAAEFVSRFFYDRPGLPAIALTTDTSMLTAIGNDYGFESLFSRQIEAQGQSGDLFIGISTSGNSKNILKAVAAAHRKGITTVALCGASGKLLSEADYKICVPSNCTPFIQESHIVIGHAICAYVERMMFPVEE